MEIEINTPSIEIEPVAPELEIEIGGSVVKDDYEKMKNLPSINGVELKGNLTTEDLKIEIPEVDLSNHYNKQETDKLLEQKEDKRVYIEANIDYNPSTGSASLKNWITENPYQIADKENKKDREVILRGYLYVGDTFLETIYLSQTIYSEGAYGNFKYFLGFIDDKNLAHLRLNSNGSVTCGLKTFE